MKGGFRCVFAAAVLLAAPAVLSQGLRPGFAAGMGVNYGRMKDVVALANSAGGTTERIPDFNAGVEFFGRGTLPLSEGWALAFDYAYEVTTLSAQTAFGTAQFTVIQHAPTLVVERILAAEPLYTLVAGIGAGYHAGILERESLYLNDRFTASGPALLGLLEGNTALGENLFACLGLTARWGFLGKLTDDAGRGPGNNLEEPTLRQFGVGARLGLTYMF